MIRVFGTERPAFVLETPGLSYAFRILPTGQPEQLCCGTRLPLETEAEVLALSEQRAFAPGNTVVYDAEHPELSLEDVCLEFSAPGKGDSREPMLVLVNPDGSRTSDFVYQSHSIDDSQPPQSPLPGSYGETGAFEQGAGIEISSPRRFAPPPSLRGAGAEHLCVSYRDRNCGLTLETHYWLWADCDCLCRRNVLRNTGDGAVEIERFLSMQLDLPERALAVTGFFGAWAREMEKHCIPLSAGKLVLESRGGASSSRCNPFFIVHDPAATERSGDCWGFHLLYSGSHYAAVERSAFGKTRVVSGLQPEGFRWLLAPGESFESPEAVLCHAPAGFTGLSQKLHFFVREHVVRGRWKRKTRPILLNSWEACYFDISERGLVALAKAGRDIGVELFVLDDGWFTSRSDDSRALGDWTPDPKKLPGGLAGLCRRINALGMQFGLWVEPEMVNRDSALFRAHPDWAMSIPGQPHAEGRQQRLLDLANPAVQDHLIETMTALFSSAPISYVKWDYNRNFSDVFSPQLPARRQGETAHRYILGLYRILGELTRRFPDILFEGCAAGGNRFDLGILCFFPQIWASDNTDALARARMQEAYSYGYPLSCVAAHVSACPNHQTLRNAPLDSRFAVAAFGLLGYELDLRDLSPAQRKELRAQVETYRRWREVLQFGDFYRVRAGNDHQWCCVAPDKSRAVGLFFRELAQANRPNDRFFAKGLDPARRYRFRNEPKAVDVRRFGSLINTSAPIHIRPDSFLHDLVAKLVKLPGEREDHVLSGAQLMTAGVPLRQGFAAVGHDERVRCMPDFSSRLYFMEAGDAQAPASEGLATAFPAKL